MENFIINWILINEIAISSAPYKDEEFSLIKKFKIKTILCLCNDEEYPIKFNYQKNNFNIIRKPLPDHRHNKPLDFKIIDEILINIETCLKDGPILIHCQYAIERSPIICLIWLIKSQKIKFNDALDYMKSIHKNTNPLNSQIKEIKEFLKYKKINY